MSADKKDLAGFTPRVYWLASGVGASFRWYLHRGGARSPNPKRTPTYPYYKVVNPGYPTKPRCKILIYQRKRHLLGAGPGLDSCDSPSALSVPRAHSSGRAALESPLRCSELYASKAPAVACSDHGRSVRVSRAVGPADAHSSEQVQDHHSRRS